MPCIKCGCCSHLCGCSCCYGDELYRVSHPSYNPYEDDEDDLRDDYLDIVLEHYCSSCVSKEDSFVINERITELVQACDTVGRLRSRLISFRNEPEEFDYWSRECIRMDCFDEDIGHHHLCMFPPPPLYWSISFYISDLSLPRHYDFVYTFLLIVDRIDILPGELFLEILKFIPVSQLRSS